LALLTCPNMSNGKKVCHNFIVKGGSCECGWNCHFQHVTTRSNTTDLSILHSWAVVTKGITWIAPDPPQCHPNQSNNGGSSNTNNSSHSNSNNEGSTGQPTASG
jgi:hypothetical protein